MKVLNTKNLLTTSLSLRYKIMSCYCLKCKKTKQNNNNNNNNNNINPRVSKTRNDKTIMLSKCAICSSKSSRFIKK